MTEPQPPAAAGIVRWSPPRRRGARAFAFQAETAGRRGAHPHLDWVTTRSRLSAAACDTVTALGRSMPQEAPTVVGGATLNDHRVGRVHPLPDVLATQPIYSLMWEVARDAAERHYHLAITGIARRPHYVEYEAGYGHFHWHNDYSHESEQAPRKLTVVLQLSDGADYAGGDLEVFDVEPRALPRERGSILCLPSFVPHRVTPVTAGTRRIVVAWISGPRLL